MLRKVDGLDEAGARWTPGGRLIPLLGIVNHLTRVEWRWIDGGMLGAEVSRSEEEFRPGPELPWPPRSRPTASGPPPPTPSSARCRWTRPAGDAEQADLRFVLLHLINETARHAGHADAVRELLDGTTGE